MESYQWRHHLHLCWILPSLLFLGGVNIAICPKILWIRAHINWAQTYNDLSQHNFVEREPIIQLQQQVLVRKYRINLILDHGLGNYRLLKLEFGMEVLYQIFSGVNFFSLESVMDILLKDLVLMKPFISNFFLRYGFVNVILSVSGVNFESRVIKLFH